MNQSAERRKARVDRDAAGAFFPPRLDRLIATSLLIIALGLAGCNYPASTPTGVAAPGHDWLEGGD
jgi:hypothetical protein